MRDSDERKFYVRIEHMHPRANRTAHPDLDSVIYVNDDMNPVLINNEHFTGHVVFRVRNFDGWTPLAEDYDSSSSTIATTTTTSGGNEKKGSSLAKSTSMHGGSAPSVIESMSCSSFLTTEALSDSPSMDPHNNNESSCAVLSAKTKTKDLPVESKSTVFEDAQEGISSSSLSSFCGACDDTHDTRSVGQSTSQNTGQSTSQNTSQTTHQTTNQTSQSSFLSGYSEQTQSSSTIYSTSSRLTPSLPPIPDCPHYFENHKRTFSFQISGRFRRQWTGDDIMFGTYLRKPVSLPRGSGLALAVAKRIDPGMEYNLTGDSPYVTSPILCAMNTIHIQPLLAASSASLNFVGLDKNTPIRSSPSHPAQTSTSSSNSAAAKTTASTTTATTTTTATKRADDGTTEKSRKRAIGQPPSSSPPDPSRLSLHDTLQPKINSSTSMRSSLYETAVQSNRDQLEREGEPLTLPVWRYGGEHEILSENLMTRWHSWTMAPTPRQHDSNQALRSAHYQHRICSSASLGDFASPPMANKSSSKHSKSKNKRSAGAQSLVAGGGGSVAVMETGHAFREEDGDGAVYGKTPSSPSATMNIAHTSTTKALSKASRHNRTSAADRRRWFLDENHRKRFIFHPDTVYSFDFASPYVDMNTLTLKLGFNINVCKYLNDQPVRYECRSRDGNIVFFAFELGLL